MGDRVRLKFPEIFKLASKFRHIIVQGTNNLPSINILKEDIEKIINGSNKNGRIPEFWDGHTAERIINILAELHSQKVDLS